ncbi:unnamed protein product [Caenorhabditis angaria]|uniref:Serpentine receptor class gamma n=1 Tax=Caenorhabditis angaria TaxID=860376 RepID=A0A9P1IUL5_9PELO|nr:unnamed protein product [Caenorhabditis angaria]
MNQELGLIEKRFLVGSLLLYHGILILIYILSTIIIFPLFIHFTRINREKDREVPIYRITNHLYQITVFSQSLILLSAVSIIWIILSHSKDEYNNEDKFDGMILLIALILLAIVYQFNQIIVPIQNLLIFLLAFQRFLLYFYPTSEKYIVPSEKSFKILIRWLYSISICGNIIYTIFLIGCLATNKAMFLKACNPVWPNLNSAIYITLDFLVMFSSIFYICILISVRKITSLASSVMKNRPEKVIIYQTLVLIVVKLLSIPLTLVFCKLLEDLTLSDVLTANSDKNKGEIFEEPKEILEDFELEQLFD